MSRLVRPKPPRLLDLRPEDDPWEVASLLHSALRAPEDPTPRAKWRIRNSLRYTAERRRHSLRLAVVGSVLFLTGGVVAAVIGPIWVAPSHLKEPVRDPGSTAPPSRARHGRSRPVGGAAEPVPTAAEPTPELNSTLGEPPVAAPATEIDSVPAQTPPATQTVAEARIVSTVSAQRPVAPVPPHRAKAVATVPAQVAVKLALVRPNPPKIDLSPLPSPPTQSAPTSPLPPSSLEPTPMPVNRATHPPQVPTAVAAPHSVAQPSTPATNHAPPPPTPAPLAAPAAVSANEHGLVAAALRSLRSEKRPDRALAALDDYLARFPKGVLYPEAMRLRTEALLQMGRKHTALDELDRQAFDGTTGDEERRFLRGELRADEGRWREAFEDFDAVVRARPAQEKSARSGESKANDRAERALWGRASARSHMGDDAGARADIHEYLRRFPQGRFADRATRLLDEHR